MLDLPTGTVTFLFTDIEGSTTLWEQHPTPMRQALVRHDALVEQIVAEHHGQVVRPRGEGDSRFAVFARATDAVTAAAALQQALHAEKWPTPTPLRVRMALHTGEADLREGDYYGSVVNRCARLRAVAHGGQTLVSLATEQLVRGQLLGGATLRDFGEHRLKDLQLPEHVFQLEVHELPTDFPPLKTLDARPNNLPVQRDLLIGREQEVADIVEMLRRPSVGHVTLTGPGGVGKTRLALQVAAELLDTFSDGVWIVDLAPIADPGLVASTIAQTLGVKDTHGQPLSELLTTHLRDKQLLLVPDNFEQVVEAAPLLTTLLAAAAHLKILVTSREVLHLSGEHQYDVPPLALPDLDHLPTTERLSQQAAIALFIQRARAARMDFYLTDDSARAVAEICVRLDGLPLAIELAAARIKVFPPRALVARLAHALQVLAGGARDHVVRQQTLRDTIAWSFRLLDPPLQLLFVRLGVFVGGCTIEAAEAVCAADGALAIDTVEGVISLVDKSLLRQEEGRDGEPRFRLLETLRAFAVEQLAAHPDARVCLRQHALFFMAMAEDAALMWRGAETRSRLNQLADEHDNLRAALSWALDNDDAELAARLASALHEFWIARGHQAEGRRWLERVLAVEHTLPASVRAKVLLAAGALARSQSDYELATRLYQECLALAQGEDDRRGIVEALAALAFAIMVQSADFDRASMLYEQSLALYRELGDKVGMASALAALGYVALEHDDRPRMSSLLDESLALYREVGDQIGIGSVLCYYGWAALADGAVGRGLTLFEESMRLFDAVGHKDLTAYALLGLGNAAVLAGDVEHGRAHLARGLTLYAEVGDTVGSVWVLESLEVVAALSGHPIRAARLAGVIEATKTRIKLVNPRTYGVIAAHGTAARAQIDDAAWDAAWAEGQAMTLEQAVAYALEEPDA